MPVPLSAKGTGVTQLLTC